MLTPTQPVVGDTLKTLTERDTGASQTRSHAGTTRSMISGCLALIPVAVNCHHLDVSELRQRCLGSRASLARVRSRIGGQLELRCHFGFAFELPK